MKKVITTIAVSIICFTSQVSCYATGLFTYAKSLNPFIEVSITNVLNTTYAIIGVNGKVVQSGVIAGNTILKIKTNSLKKGTYKFIIDGNNMQAFTIK